MADSKKKKGNNKLIIAGALGLGYLLLSGNKSQAAPVTDNLNAQPDPQPNPGPQVDPALEAIYSSMEAKILQLQTHYDIAESNFRHNNGMADAMHSQKKWADYDRYDNARRSFWKEMIALKHQISYAKWVQNNKQYNSIRERISNLEAQLEIMQYDWQHNEGYAELNYQSKIWDKYNYYDGERRRIANEMIPIRAEISLLKKSL